MSVFLHRIDQQNISSQTNQLIEKEVDIVLKDHSVFHGIVKTIDSEKIVILNMIRNKYVFEIKEINEIVYSS